MRGKPAYLVGKYGVRSTVYATNGWRRHVLECATKHASLIDKKKRGHPGRHWAPERGCVCVCVNPFFLLVLVLPSTVLTVCISITLLICCCKQPYSSNADIPRAPCYQNYSNFLSISCVSINHHPSKWMTVALQPPLRPVNRSCPAPPPSLPANQRAGGPPDKDFFQGKKTIETIEIQSWGQL